MLAPRSVACHVAKPDFGVVNFIRAQVVNFPKAPRQILPALSEKDEQLEYLAPGDGFAALLQLLVLELAVVDLAQIWAPQLNRFGRRQ